MKIPNKQELQGTASNNSSDIDFKNFMNLYKTCTGKPYYSLVIDATRALEMKNYNTILTAKRQKYQHCHPEKLINMSILQVKK